MSRIRHICSPFTRLTRLPATALRASQPTGQAAHLSARSGRDGIAGRFIASVAVGHRLGRPGRRTRTPGDRPWATRAPSAVPSAGSAGQHWPASIITMSRWRTVVAPGLLPRTVQLCTHCRQGPAGFWVSGTGGQTVRRPSGDHAARVLSAASACAACRQPKPRPPCATGRTPTPGVQGLSPHAVIETIDRQFASRHFRRCRRRIPGS